MRTLEDIFGNIKPTEKRQMGYRFKTDFLFFMEKVLGYKPAEFQTKFLNLLFQHRFISIMCSRQHGKTLCFSQCYPVWRMYRDSGTQICLTSSSKEQSRDFMRDAQFMIEENEYLNKILLPDKMTKDWGGTNLICKNKSRYFLRPFNDTIKGIHPDIYICDDILREENVTQEHIKEKFWSIIFPTIIATKGQIVLVGTPQTSDDLFHDLDSVDETGNRNYPEWVNRLVPIVKVDDEGNWLKPTWHEHFTIEDIKGILKNMGFLKFNRECMCNPLAGGDKIFSEEVIKRQLHPMILNKARPNKIYYLGIDVAISKSKTADWSVFSTIEKDIKTGLCYQVRQDRPPRDNDMQKKLNYIKYLHGIFNYRKGLIEDKGLSKGLVVDAKNDPIIRHFIEGFNTRHENKEMIISHLAAGLQSGSLFILQNPILIKEMASFGLKKKKDGSETYESLGGKDDCVIALALAYEAATQMKGATGVEIITY